MLPAIDNEQAEREIYNWPAASSCRLIPEEFGRLLYLSIEGGAGLASGPKENGLVLGLQDVVGWWKDSYFWTFILKCYY